MHFTKTMLAKYNCDSL